MLVLLPGHLLPPVACGVVAVTAGAVMLAEAGAPVLEVVRWSGTGVGTSALAVWATHASGLLMQRELEAERARSDALGA